MVKYFKKLQARTLFAYLKDYRFSSILLKYFLMLLICLVLPVTSLSVWYKKQTKENLQHEIIKRNEASLKQAYDNVYSIIKSSQNLAYQLSGLNAVEYLATKSSVRMDASDNRDNLRSSIGIVESSNTYIDSICIYFRKSKEFLSDSGWYDFEDYSDVECLELYSEDMSNRTVVQPRKKYDKYPYLLTILQPISTVRDSNAGAVIINIDVEKMGEHIGSGRYRNKDYSPMLLIFDEHMEKMVYSDEYRLMREEEDALELETLANLEGNASAVCTLWNESYVVSHFFSEKEGFRYYYLTSMHQFEKQSQETNRLLVSVMVAIGILCLVMAVLLAAWLYKPIRHTIHMLDDVSMLTEWDKKERIDEIEAIQRSILLAKQEQDNLNERVKARMINLHNAQICALQSQINPHFLYNTLEAIGNAAALLMGGVNKVTDAIYTLGLLMRTSLAGENYLVPLEEELEHVSLYVRLVDFRFRGRIHMHIEIPKELKSEKIVKLTLQPLIENAIEHGLGRMRDGGNVWLRGARIGNKNYIHVIDDGTGISEDGIVQLRQQLKESAINGSSHIGMRNVNQRLKLVFGEEAGLTVRRAEEGGLCVTVEFRTL